MVAFNHLSFESCLKEALMLPWNTLQIFSTLSAFKQDDTPFEFT